MPHVHAAHPKPPGLTTSATPRCSEALPSTDGHIANNPYSSSQTIGSPNHWAKHDGGARRDRTDDLMLAKHALSQLSYGPFLVQEVNVASATARCACVAALRRAASQTGAKRESLLGAKHRKADRPLRPPGRSAGWRLNHEVVGLGRLELPTSRLSSARSNQLSYKPQTPSLIDAEAPCQRATVTGRNPMGSARQRLVRGRRGNEGGAIPHNGSD